MDYSAFVKVEFSERAPTMTLNRPQVRNAVNAALHHEALTLTAKDHEEAVKAMSEKRKLNFIRAR